MKISKATGVGLFAVLTTTAIFHTMQGLVGAEAVSLDTPRTYRIPVINFEVKSDDDVRVSDRLKPPPPPEDPPPVPETDSDLGDDVGPGVPWPPGPKPSPPIGDINHTPLVADGDIIPVVRVTPSYPPSAAEKGIEGWVVLEFDVDSHGMVVDPRIIAYEPSPVFNRTSLKAIRKFRYKPRVIDGKAYPVTDIRFRMVYTLD